MTKNLVPYPAYKYSGAKWIGEVPDHWEIRPHRSLYTEVITQDCANEQMLSVTIAEGVILQDSLLQGKSQKDSSRIDKSAYKLVCPGDLAYNKMRAWQGAAGVSTYRGIVSPAYIVQRPCEEVDPSYAHYLLRTPAFAKEAERWSYGIASDMWSLRPEHFKMIRASLPPLDEQAAIVRYLDYVDRRVRRYVAAKRKLIALLEEERQAVIHQAVTRGLDPNVPLKPSGVEWLGDIPAHWETRRLKTIALLRYGLGQPPKELSNGLPLIRATNVSRGNILSQDMVYVDPEDVPSARNALLSENEIIVVRSGAYTADSALVPREYAGAVTGYDMVVTVRAALPEFIALTLLSKYVRDDQLVVESMRSAQPHLNSEELGSALILIPPIGEQTSIADYLKKATSRIDTAIARARRQIELLEEYRTRLIADVVTGKLDVRAAAADLPLEDDDEEPAHSESGPREAPAVTTG
jgi:type I restriction enzyme S subunit